MATLQRLSTPFVCFQLLPCPRLMACAIRSARHCVLDDAPCADGSSARHSDQRRAGWDPTWVMFSIQCYEPYQCDELTRYREVTSALQACQLLRSGCFHVASSRPLKSCLAQNEAHECLNNTLELNQQSEPRYGAKTVPRSTIRGNRSAKKVTPFKFYDFYGLPLIAKTRVTTNASQPNPIQ